MKEIKDMNSGEMARLQGELDSAIKNKEMDEAQKKKEKFEFRVEEEHHKVVSLCQIRITEDNISLFKEQYPEEEIKLKDIVVDNKALSDLIEKDELTLFQMDYLMDECNPDMMSKEAKEKLERLQAEIYFLLQYYKVI